MSALPAEQLWTAERFLEWERNQPRKHELLNGAVYAMAGASRWHILIAGNLGAAFNAHFRRRNCEVYQSDMRVQAETDYTYTFPDVVVVCGKPRFRADADQDTLENPLLIFEILSPSTEIIDRNIKRVSYLRLESLEGYYMVSQDRPLIEAFERRGGLWRQLSYAGLDATLPLPAIDFELPLREIYHKVALQS